MIVEWYKDGFGQYRYRLKSNNGHIMLMSCSYSTYRKCVEGWRTVQKSLYIDDFDIRYRWAKEML
jgi:uncharacterized protein YegP (UPF0339 family)